MKKKIVALSLCVAMLAIAVIGGTLAYFTDKDQVNNTFTIGNIDIDLYEYVGKTEDEVDDDGQPTGEKVPVKEQTGNTYSNVMPGDELEKEVHIKNESDTNAAYVRVAVVMNNVAAINDAIDGVYEGKHYDADAIQAIYDEVFEGWGVNYSKRAEYPSGSRMWMDSRVGESSPVLCNIDTISRINDDYYRIDCANAFMTEEEKATENGDGIFDVNWDDLSVSYYVNAAKTGERVYVFYLKLNAGEDYKLFDGLNAPAEFDNEQMKMFDNLKINIYADAIQVDNFTETTADDGSTIPAYVNAFNALEAAHPLGWWN